MKKTTAIVVVVLGFVLFLIGISLLICSAIIVYNIMNQHNFQPLYALVRDETTKGIQTAGKLCAIFGGATALLGLFKNKKDNKQ